jgi:hypothetical protein
MFQNLTVTAQVGTIVHQLLVCIVEWMSADTVALADFTDSEASGKRRALTITEQGTSSPRCLGVQN